MGDYGKLINSTHNLDTLTGSGFFRWGDNIPANAPFTYGVMLQIDRGVGSVFQKVWRLGTSAKTQVSAERVVNDNVGEWEWDNPPMSLGVEYRTTERVNGKAVYIQAVDFGYLPNNSTKTITMTGVNYPFSVVGVTDTGRSIPHANYITVRATDNTLEVGTTLDYATVKAVFIVKYLKAAP